jgi:hypothetical protein
MSPKQKRLFTSLTIVLVMALFGPELWLGLEFASLIEVMGAAAFWSSLWIGIKMNLFYFVFKPVSHSLIGVFTPVYHSLTKWDPNFFIPNREIIRKYPAMLVHAVPSLLLIYCLLGTTLGAYILTNIL